MLLLYAFNTLNPEEQTTLTEGLCGKLKAGTSEVLDTDSRRP
jgi:hypothetical protein